GRLSEVDARSDVSSLGATLYEMLAGSPPFEGEVVINIIKKMLTEDAISPRRSNPGLSKDIETICLKCLRKDPEHRYASAMALAEDLARMLEGKPILARPIGRFSRLWRRARRNKAAAIGIAGMVLLALALGLFTLGPGGVSIQSEPPGAAVLLDGRETGWRTPVEGRLLWPPGTYRIALLSDGFDRVEGEVKVSPLATEGAAFTLVKDHGFVKIAVRPPGAAVTFLVDARRVEGASHRCEPVTLPETERANPAPPVKEREEPYSFRCYRLPKGAHGLEMAAKDFETHRAVLFVTPDHVQTLVQDLLRQKGRLMVLSNVKDVSMKAYRKGTSRLKPLVFSIPWRDIPLDAGTWHLEFEKVGYWKSIRIVTIKGGKRPVVVHAHMRKKK
ncbi:MAG: serine/threonine protein kinase, partial [Planctomycetota bacterium]